MNEAFKALRPVVLVFVLLGLLWWGFDAFLAQRDHPNRAMVTGAGAAQRLVLDASPGGHYFVPGEINGERVTFLVDTGASHVAVPAHLAERLGLSSGRRIGINTAAGRTFAYDTTIDEIAIGGLSVRHVGGSINPSMESDFVLLGMTFLRHVDLRQRGGQLIMEAADRRR